MGKADVKEQSPRRLSKTRNETFDKVPNLKFVRSSSLTHIFALHWQDYSCKISFCLRFRGEGAINHSICYYDVSDSIDSFR